jgi:hypothetical protein
LKYIGIYWNILEYIEIYWYLYWNILKYLGIYWIYLIEYINEIITIINLYKKYLIKKITDNYFIYIWIELGKLLKKLKNK